MRKVMFGIFLSLLSGFGVFAAPPEKDAVDAVSVVKVLVPENAEIGHGEALKLVSEMKAKLSKEQFDETFPPKKSDDDKDDELNGLTISSYAGRMTFISKSLNVEEDSGIYRKWFVELAKTLDYLAKFRRTMESAIADRNKKEYQENLELYKRGSVYFIGLVGKPPRIAKDDLVKIKEENDKLRRKIQAEASKAKGR